MEGVAKLGLDDENGLSRLRNCRRLTPRRASVVTHNYALEEALQGSGENRCNEDEADEDSVVGRGAPSGTTHVVTRTRRPPAAPLVLIKEVTNF